MYNNMWKLQKSCGKVKPISADS